MSIRGTRGLRGSVQTPFGAVQAAPAGSIPLWSFSQNPNVPAPSSPIYPVGSPQYLAAIASGATPTPSYTPDQIAAMMSLPGGAVNPLTPLQLTPLPSALLTTSTTNISPISATQMPVTPTNFLYTADEETVQQLLYQYGDTWDNPQTIVNQLYAAGIAPGTVSQANALPYLTGITSAAATTASSSLSSTLSSMPSWGWAAIGIGALLLFGKK